MSQENQELIDEILADTYQRNSPRAQVLLADEVKRLRRKEVTMSAYDQMIRHSNDMMELYLSSPYMDVEHKISLLTAAVLDLQLLKLSGSITSDEGKELIERQLGLYADRLAKLEGELP